MAAERQSGSYGLRKSAAPKKYDSDFEYYYTKTKIAGESPEQDLKMSDGSKSLHSTLPEVFEAPHSPKRRYEVHVLDSSGMNLSDSPTKRSRGRPRKNPLPEEQPPVIPDEADMDVNYIHLKPKRDRRLLKEEKVEECHTVESVIESLEHGLGQELLVEEVIPHGETHVIISAESDEKQTHLEDLRRARDIMEVEQAVISLPQHDEKENLPASEIEVTEIIPEESNEEILMLGMGSDEDCQIHELSEVRVEVGTDGVEIPRKRRKYRKIKATAETLQNLKDFGADDKIECNECHKLLKPSSFRQHLKTHSGVKPFFCEICEARFTRKGDVERHVRIVHNKQKPFSCHRCSRSFGDKKNLRWHLMNHDKKLFYVCETCGFKFGKKEYYENHVKFIHPIFEFVEDDEVDCADLATSLLSTTMEVEGEGPSGADPLNLHTYTSTSNFIKKGNDLLTGLDSTESEEVDGETLEITESQLQNLLQQNAMGKHIAIITPKRSKVSTKSNKIIPVKIPKKSTRNAQVITVQQVSDMSSDHLAEHQVSSDHIGDNEIEAVVIQINQTGVSENEMSQDTVGEGEVILVESTGIEEDDQIIVDPQSVIEGEEGHELVEDPQADLQSEVQEVPREVNIVVSKSSSQEGGEADANVQSLIDALLDAAKDASQNSE